ncbi:uncharacterized protein LTR77_000361 [Saxophila tyrrhenica]|uniref:Thioesterase domain-containing protein n=1 Tax=Saxophila tyrrhenica TaxID=1690608 RepID=A0AAV9PQA6_9PEZI|nr:hypothetical protein LTR77_000361 [Saxophila tyrrhenica]
MAPAPRTSSNAEGETDLVMRLKKDIFERKYMKQLENDPVQNANLAWMRVVEIMSVEKLSETTARAVFRLPVQREYLNPAQGLHGGMAAAMFDTMTTWTLYPIRKPGFWMLFGTTRTLNLTYLRPAPEGEMMLMECEVVHAGKRLCLIKGTLRRERDGAIISTCEHQKYNNDPEVAKA